MLCRQRGNVILFTMGINIIFAIIVVTFGFSEAFNQTSESFLGPFLKQKPKTVNVCDFADDDQFYEEMFEISAKSLSIWVNIWDCIVSDLPQTQDSLIILNEITSEDLITVFSKKNIQNSITYNTWVIHINKELPDIYSIFDDIKIKIGINAQIFIVQSSHLNHNVVQVIGTGLKKVDFKASFSYHRTLIVI